MSYNDAEMSSSDKKKNNHFLYCRCNCAKKDYSFIYWNSYILEIAKKPKILEGLIQSLPFLMNIILQIFLIMIDHDSLARSSINMEKNIKNEEKLA